MNACIRQRFFEFGFSIGTSKIIKKSEIIYPESQSIKYILNCARKFVLNNYDNINIINTIGFFYFILLLKKRVKHI